MSVAWQHVWEQVKTSFGASEREATRGTPSLLSEIRQAREEWLSAQQYFQSVTEVDLIDHAITVCRACEQKYDYLLRKAKKEGLSNIFALE